MKELPRNWFGNERFLPLDENGRVDFSLDQRNHSGSGEMVVDPLADERFMGRRFQKVQMPDGGKIIMLYRWDDADAELPLHTTNHNVFRLDPDGKIVWQVQRSERKFVNWESRNQHAKEDDPECEGYSDPFFNMGDRFFTRKKLPERGPFHPKFEKVYSDTYIPGNLLWLSTSWWAYDLDPETGIATCTGEQVK